MASKRKVEALASVAARGGTENEREVAAAKLKNQRTASVPALVTDESGSTWQPWGVMCRIKGEARAFLRAEALQHFLKHCRNGVPLTNRSIPLDDCFGPGDFYLIVGWFQALGICTKEGSRYTVHNKDHAIVAWNQAMERNKL